jgi:hypothetical protein
MLFQIPYISHPDSEYLQDQVIHFFNQLVLVNKKTSIEPLTQFFQPSFHGTLNGSPKLQLKIRRFLNAYRGISARQRLIITTAFSNSQEIQNILEDISFDGKSINKIVLPSSIRTRTYDLFIHLYEVTLKSIGDLDTHYRVFFNEIKHKICPFCGVEGLFAPHRRKQDYDHLIKKETYPFPSVNMRNLVPMGRDCNQVYKNRLDVLYQGTVRRVFAYPYSKYYSITVSLHGSVLPTSTGLYKNGNWKVSFSIDNDFIESWDRIFNIRGRYSDEFLAKYWKDWLEEFKERAKLSNVTTIRKLIRAYRTEARILSIGFTDNKIIKSAYFRFLADCGEGSFNQAVLKEIRS